MTTTPVYASHASYMDSAFGDLSVIADRMLESVTDPIYGVEFDTMVGTGLSGTLVVPYLARTFGTYWAIVRKPDNTHSSNQVEGKIGQRWLFVDDLVCSGNTLRRVQAVISTTAGPKTQYVGCYEYYWNCTRP